MPLLRKKPFVPIDLPPDLKADEEVFLNILTKEIFRDYEEYFKRSILCKSLVWSCEYTGRASLTLQEALESEAEAAEHLQKMPIALQQGIVYILHKHEIASLNTFVDQVLLFYRNRYLVGEEVEITAIKGTSSGCVLDIMVETGSDYRYPADIIYTCKVGDTEVPVQGNKICRKKNALTRERVKLLVKCSAIKVSTDPPLYAVKDDHIERLYLNSENLLIPYLMDFGKTPPKPPKSGIKRRSREKGDEEYVPKNKKKKKIDIETQARDTKSPDKEYKIPVEERRKQIEEERARKRKQRQQEREHHKRLGLAEQNFKREWMKPREDLELTDSTELPDAPPVDTALPAVLFGDVLMVGEFFHLFGEHVDLAEEFPDGIPIGKLEESLITQKHSGMFGDVVIFLLKLVFALQLEEDEEEQKFATKYNFTHVSPELDTETVTIVPEVTWQQALQTTPDLPFLGAARAYFFTDFYLGTPISKLQLDSYTVTEILRLHVLGAGGRSNGAQYYGRWRHNCRGMYTDTDNPCVELRNTDPSLMKMLAISNIYDLPPASKLTILKTLITEVLTYAQFREIIEEAMEGARQAKKDWKGFENERTKRKKEEAATKYKLWLASRVKIKQAKKQKKQGRVSDMLASYDTTTDSDMDRSVQYDTDISQLVEDSTVEEIPDLQKREAEEESRDLEQESHDNEQESQLYAIFREISCKLKVRPLGQDRYFRKYWTFSCAPGIFVEESSVNIADLFEEEDDSSSVCSSQSYNKHTDHGKQTDIKHNGYSHTKCTEHVVNNGNSLPVPGNNDSNTSTDILTIADTSSMTVDEIVQLKIREATLKSGVPATTYTQLQNTPGFNLLRSDRQTWTHYNTEQLIGHLGRRLNPRGEREKDLLETLNKDKVRILRDLKLLPAVRRYDADAEAEEVTTDETEEQQHARQVLKRTSAEKLMEAYLREQISDLENRMFEANFGAVKVGNSSSIRNRIAWRKEIEDFWLDDSVKYKKSKDIPDIPQSILNQHLETLRSSQPDASSQSSSLQMTTGSSKVVSRRSIISELREALLSVEKGIPAKYLAPPLGSTAARGGSAARQPGKLEQWRESLGSCTTLSQITLHVLTLDCSITWAKSILKANCRVCRRKSDPDKMLLCDKCDRGQHIYCLTPKLKSIPSGKWFCNICKPAARDQARTKHIPISSSDESSSDEELSKQPAKQQNKPQTAAEKLKCCSKIHDILEECEDGWPFLYPVDGKQIPDYYTIIPNPSDLSTIRSKLNSNKYRTVKQYVDDVQQIFLNCRHYNTSRAPVYKAGVRLKKMFDNKLREFGLS